MNKKFTLLIIPDDDSGTKSYNISKNLLKYFIISISVILIVFIFISIKLIPGISKYDDLKKKYNKNEENLICPLNYFTCRFYV